MYINEVLTVLKLEVVLQTSDTIKHNSQYWPATTSQPWLIFDSLVLILC